MKVTDYIDKAIAEGKFRSKRQFFIRLKIDQQNYSKWKNGSVPMDKTLFKIAEMVNVEPIEIIAVARSNDKEGTEETRSYWRKKAKEEMKSHPIAIKIKNSQEISLKSR